MLGISEEMVCPAGGVGTRVPLAAVGDFPWQVKGCGRGPDRSCTFRHVVPSFSSLEVSSELDEPLSVPETD